MNTMSTLPLPLHKKRRYADASGTTQPVEHNVPLEERTGDSSWTNQWFGTCTFLQNMLRNVASRVEAKFQFESYPTPNGQSYSMTCPVLRDAFDQLPEDNCFYVDLDAHLPLTHDEVCELGRSLKEMHMTLMATCSHVIRATYKSPVLFHDNIYIVHFHFSGTQ